MMLSPRQFERAPVAGRGNVAGVADDLPGRADHPRHLDPEIVRIVIDPAGQAEIVERIDGGLCETGGHEASLAASDAKVAPDDFQP